jgi:Rad3-related DNA helicase
VETIDESENGEKARSRPQNFLKKLLLVNGSKQHLTFIPKEKEELFIKPFEISNEILSSGLTAEETLRQFHSAILFSATIGDEKLFKEEFGLGEQTRVLKLTSLPHETGLLLAIDTELDSTFKKRAVNMPKYAEKVKTMLKQDNSLLVSCCNQFETSQMLEAIPELENGAETQNFSAEKAYAINIRTKHARSTNKANKVRNCIVTGLPLPDYSDFYFKQRKEYLEKKYGEEHAGKIINRKAIDIAIQLMGRITRDLKNPKTMVLADKRYKHDFFLHNFYFESLPEYLKPYIKIVNNNEELEKELKGFWNGRR